MARRRRNSSCISSPDQRSSAENGSSRNRFRVRRPGLRAMPTCCCWPPDSSAESSLAAHRARPDAASRLPVRCRASRTAPPDFQRKGHIVQHRSVRGARKTGIPCQFLGAAQLRSGRGLPRLADVLPVRSRSCRCVPALQADRHRHERDYLEPGNSPITTSISARATSSDTFRTAGM